MRKWLSFMFVALMALPALGQGASIGDAPWMPLMSARDTVAASFEYCLATGEQGAPWNSQGRPGFQRVKTVGSTTTVTSFTAAAGAWTPVSVGDELFFPMPSGILELRYVAAKASADSITIGPTAIDLSTSASGHPYRWLKVVCGSTAADGWVPIRGFLSANFVVRVDTLNATSIDYTVECKTDGSNTGPVTVKALTALTAVGAASFVINDPWTACRMGTKVTGDVGVNSVSAYVESRR